jgi:hypothetical protein
MSRSRLTNGSVALAGVDGRTAQARRFRDLLDGFLREAGDTSEFAQSLARRAAALSIFLEGEEAKLVSGQPVDIGGMTTAANALRRLLADLGIKREART